MKKSEQLSVGLVYDDSLDSSDGVAQYVKTLGAWLSGQGHSVTYLAGQSKTQTWSAGSVISLARNLKIRWSGNNLSMPIWPDRKAIKRVLGSEHFDVLHVQVPYSPLMSQVIINRADVDTAVIGTFHVFPGNKASRFGARLLKIAYGRSLGRFDEIVSVSTVAASFASDGFGITSSISPNVVDVRKFQNAKNIRKERPRIVFLGRLVKRKGSLQLLRAFRLLCDKLPEVDLVIAGDGPMKPKLVKYVRSHNLQNRVSFLGYINEADKPSLLNSADVACFPSLYGESFGIVLIEAMAAGAKIVIGGNNPGYQSVLKNRPQLLVNPENAAGFAGRLYEMLSGEADIEKLHAWQTNEVKQYDIEQVGPRLVQVYRQQIARRLKKSNN